MLQKEINHLKSMKLEVPAEWATDKYVLVDEFGGWPWDKEKFPDGGMYTMPPSREPDSTIKRMLELMGDNKIPVVIISEIITHKRQSQTIRHQEIKEMMALSRVCILLIEREAGRFERLVQP